MLGKVFYSIRKRKSLRIKYKRSGLHRYSRFSNIFMRASMGRKLLRSIPVKTRLLGRMRGGKSLVVTFKLPRNNFFVNISGKNFRIVAQYTPKILGLLKKRKVRKFNFWEAMELISKDIDKKIISDGRKRNIISLNFNFIGKISNIRNILNVFRKYNNFKCGYIRHESVKIVFNGCFNKKKKRKKHRMKRSFIYDRFITSNLEFMRGMAATTAM